MSENIDNERGKTFTAQKPMTDPTPTPTPEQIAEGLELAETEATAFRADWWNILNQPGKIARTALALAGRLAEARGQLRYQRILTEQIQTSHDLAATAVAEAPREDGWRPIETALDDKDIAIGKTHFMLFSRIHGQVEAWYAAGEWSDETPDHGREYSGSVFVLGDDLGQIEIEELSQDHHEWNYGEATHWRPLPAPPPVTELQPTKPGEKR